MRSRQKNLISLYIIVACILVFLDFIFPAYTFVYLVKFLVTLSLFALSLLLPKAFKEQIMMLIAQFFVVIADYFFVFSKWLNNGKINSFQQFAGTFCFLVAYIILILTWSKKGRHKLNLGEIIAAIFILIIFWPTVKTLAPHLSIFVKPGAFIFGFVLCLLTWTGVCAKFRNYYGKNTSKLIGLAGSLIFISDMAVAHAALNPMFSGNFVSWLSALIWLTYIPAWAMIVSIITGPNIFS